MTPRTPFLLLALLPTLLQTTAVSGGEINPYADAHTPEFSLTDLKDSDAEVLEMEATEIAEETLVMMKKAKLTAESQATMAVTGRAAPSAAIAVALAGAALTALGDHAAAPGSLFGNLLALAGAVTVAAYQVIGRGLRGALPLNAYVLGVWGVAALVLAGFDHLGDTNVGPLGDEAGQPQALGPDDDRAARHRLRRLARIDVAVERLEDRAEQVVDLVARWRAELATALP